MKRAIPFISEKAVAIHHGRTYRAGLYVDRKDANMHILFGYYDNIRHNYTKCSFYGQFNLVDKCIDGSKSGQY